MSKMVSVPVIPRKFLDKLRELFPEAYPVSRLSAHNVSGLSAAILILEIPSSTFGTPPKPELLLSPPAAAELSRLLREAVEKYLEQGDPTRSEEKDVRERL